MDNNGILLKEFDRSQKNKPTTEEKVQKIKEIKPAKEIKEKKKSFITITKK